MIARLMPAVRRVMMVSQVNGELGGARPPILRTATHCGASVTVFNILKQINFQPFTDTASIGTAIALTPLRTSATSARPRGKPYEKPA
ncbi:hypothetical protein D3C76_1610890 [compost metagenome]